MLLEQGVPLIVEENAHRGAIEAATALGQELICVSMEEEGSSSRSLAICHRSKDAIGNVRYTL